MAQLKRLITIRVDGIELKYEVPDNDVHLWVEAENCINEMIDELRQRGGKTSDGNRLLSSILVKLMIDKLRSRNESDETLQEIEEINHNLSTYLTKK